MRLLFFGTPKIAAAYLKFLAALKGHEIIGVVTGSDRPKGRGLTLSAPPVKETALRMGLAPIVQPEGLKEPGIAQHLEQLEPDLALVIAYGKILPLSIINIPKQGMINIHFSLLPKLRGASPVEHAIWQGHEKTGVTLFQIEEGMDTGPILAQAACPIAARETTFTLFEKLIPLGQQLLIEGLPQIAEKKASYQQQNHQAATYTRLIKKQDGAINWGQSAEAIDRQIRALCLWPRAFSHIGQRQIQLCKAEPQAQVSSGGQPGEITRRERGVGFFVKCGIGELLVLEVRPQGAKTMSAWAFLQGLGPQTNAIVFGGSDHE